jgi:tight adherence protein C
MDQIFFILCVAMAAAMGGYLLMRLVGGGGESKIRDRLGAGTGESGGAALGGGKEDRKSFKRMAERVGQAASKPFMPTQRQRQSALRRDLGFAGIYSPTAMRAVVGFKLILLALGLLGGYAAGIATGQVLLGVSLGGLAGYLAPAIWLRRRIAGNRQALKLGLPDALDLMVVCVEAGLTVDAAMQRMGQELSLAHPRLGREFGIAHMETRVGLSRAEALRNLGTRTGERELQSLSAMLIQADRFGTSIAAALRIHAESMRSRRQFLAEEQAAKASVKMSFPLVLFIFPATFLVMMGPTIIGLMRSALFS